MSCDRRATVRGATAAALVALIGAPGTRLAQAAGAPLRARLQAGVAAHLAARGKVEGFTAISTFVSRSDTDPGIAVVAGTMGRSRTAAVHDRTLFGIGSNTKAFTAALVLELACAGRLGLEQTLGHWLPHYPAWADVTIRRLLNMTSGIPNHSEAPRFMRAQAADRFRHYTPEQLVAYAYPSPGNHLPPRGRFFYSNTNYVLAGMIAARAGGASYAHQLRQRIFAPLGLDHSFYDPWQLPDAVTARMADGYFRGPTCSEYHTPCAVGPLAPLLGQNMRRADLTWVGPAGGIVATPRDLARWARALFGGQVLRPAQLAQMRQLVSMRTGLPIADVTPDDPEGFALGLARTCHPRLGRFWFYAGMTLGYRTALAWFPQDDLVLAASLNSQPPEGTDQIGQLLETLHCIVLRRGARAQVPMAR